MIGISGALIQIKEFGGAAAIFAADSREEHRAMPSMPFEIAVVVAGIVLVFAVFAVVLAWGDYQTRRINK